MATRRGAQFGPEELRFGPEGLDPKQFSHLSSDARSRAVSSALSVKVDRDPTPRRAVQRLRNMYEATPSEVREVGAQWYGRVHDVAQKAARTYGKSTRAAAGVVSAVSPNMDWERSNINAFDEIAEFTPRHWESIERSRRSGRGRDERTKELLQGYSVASATDSALINAKRIWVDGEDPDVVLNRRSAPKTNSFFHNINEPHKAGHVTVDGRHADIVADAMRPWRADRGISSAQTSSGRPTSS